MIQHTHGLPCAHEIAKYISVGRSIPLDCIHMHWRKLDLLSNASANNPSHEFDCMPETDLIVEQFKGYDLSKKLLILNKLRELAKPETTSLIEPEVKSKVRGHPKLKTHNSTKRDPSAFKLVKSAQDSYSPSLTRDTIASSGTSFVPKKLTMPKQKVIRTRNLKPVSYIGTLPDGLRPYISHVRDVTADGDCGLEPLQG